MIGHHLRFFLLLLIALGVTSCATPPPCPSDTVSQGEHVYVVSRGWHTEIGLPVEELNAHLAFLRPLFPGARTLMFGYGKKTFITAPPETISEYILGPVPGPAVIEITGLSVPPPEAYLGQGTIALSLPTGGSGALSDYIWEDLSDGGTSPPRIVARNSNPAGLFYAAQSRYTLLHTCNTWAADALQAAKLPVSGEDVIFSGQVMARAEDAARRQCVTGSEAAPPH